MHELFEIPTLRPPYTCPLCDQPIAMRENCLIVQWDEYLYLAHEDCIEKTIDDDLDEA